MTKTLFSALALSASLLIATPSFANEALAKSAGCASCHKADGKILGPGYKQIAEKYKGQKDAEAMLIKKVIEGGKGVWGQIPMPANTGAKPEDVKTLVKWILTQ
jgi:cytochrome c